MKNTNTQHQPNTDPLSERTYSRHNELIFTILCAVIFAFIFYGVFTAVNANNAKTTTVSVAISSVHASAGALEVNASNGVTITNLTDSELATYNPSDPAFINTDTKRGLDIFGERHNVNEANTVGNLNVSTSDYLVYGSPSTDNGCVAKFEKDNTAVRIDVYGTAGYKFFLCAYPNTISKSVPLASVNASAGALAESTGILIGTVNASVGALASSTLPSCPDGLHFDTEQAICVNAAGIPYNRF